MPPASFANGVNLQVDLGIDLEFPDRLFLPERAFPLVRIPGRMGGRRAGLAERSPRTLNANGVVRASTAAARVAAEDAFVDLVAGATWLRIDNGAGIAREILGTTLKLQFIPRGGRYAPISSEFQWSLLCEDPAWRQITPLQFAVGPARVPFAIGNVPCGWRMEIHGPAADPFTITFRRASGEAVAAMTFAGGLTDAEYAIIDGEEQTAEKVTSGGAPTPLLGQLTAGDFPKAGLSPEYGWRAQGSFGTVELSSGVGEFYAVPRWGMAP
ncbi:MAG: hypothetical protein HOP28_12160 [Gemmatimonadales bacterium]|nr:hypothetical protein [Gemmatimonadales bacterium]